MKKKQRIKLYDDLVARLPGTWDDIVTPLARIRDCDLVLLTDHCGQRFSGADAIEYEHAREQACHAMAAHAWLTNPTWSMVFGFAAVESLCSSEWHLHSFCLADTGEVVEPTPLGREYYWGVVLSEAQAASMAREELENIAKLGFTLSPAQLRRLDV